MSIDPIWLSGSELHGDDFSPEQIVEWYAREASGYFDLTGGQHDVASYGYGALHEFHAFKRLRRDHFPTALALGCAEGGDVAPLGPVVHRFIAIEPAVGWWSDSIGGKPAIYMAPSPQGDLPVADCSVDLALCMGVLHHIPNVSHTLAELARVLRPGALFVAWEPCSSMGDWSRARMGLTANERGIPRRWFIAALDKAGFEVVSARRCYFPALSIIAKKFGIKRPLASAPWVLLDVILSWAFAWNEHYVRDNIFKKMAPSHTYVIARRR